MINNISVTAKQLIICSGIVCAVIFAAGVFFIDDKLQYGLGILLGFICCCVRIVLLDRSVSKAIDMPEKSSVNYSRLQFLLRYAICAAVLITAALLPNAFSLIGAVLGTLSMQLGAYLVRVFFKESDTNTGNISS